MSELSRLSKNLLHSFVPLGMLSDDQLDVILQKSEILPVYKGQTLFRSGDVVKDQYFLLHGALTILEQEGQITVIQAGDKASFSSIVESFFRRKTVVADVDSSVLKVDKLLLENLLCWGQVARCLLAEIANDDSFSADYIWIKNLLDSKLFFKIPPINILKILSKFQQVEVKRGAIILNQGDEGTSCYLIKSGSARVFYKNSPEKTIAVLQAGAVFGEDALVTNNPRNASVSMETDGLLMRLEKKHFYQLLAQPAVTMVSAAKVAEFVATGAQLLDVRTQKEYEVNGTKTSMNVPLHLIYLKSKMLDVNRLYITCSGSEERSKAAAYFLNEQGFKAFALQAELQSINDI